LSTGGNLADQQAINQVYQQIHQACKDIGFFYITGHGVEQSTMDLLFSYAQKFFSLPLEKKTAISIDKCPSYNGYVKSGTTKYSLENCLQSNFKDQHGVKFKTFYRKYVSNNDIICLFAFICLLLKIRAEIPSTTVFLSC